MRVNAFKKLRIFPGTELGLKYWVLLISGSRPWGLRTGFCLVADAAEASLCYICVRGLKLSAANAAMAMCAYESGVDGFSRTPE